MIIENSPTLLEVRGLRKSFPIKEGLLRRPRVAVRLAHARDARGLRGRGLRSDGDGSLQGR